MFKKNKNDIEIICSSVLLSKQDWTVLSTDELEYDFIDPNERKSVSKNYIKNITKNYKENYRKSSIGNLKNIK